MRVRKLRDSSPGLVEVEVEDERALSITRALHARGFPVGPSSGLNFAAALEFRRRCSGAHTVVTVFPDRMERYFSTELFAPPRSSMPR
jgi:cysteine synthase A